MKIAANCAWKVLKNFYILYPAGVLCPFLFHAKSEIRSHPPSLRWSFRLRSLNYGEQVGGQGGQKTEAGLPSTTLRVFDRIFEKSCTTEKLGTELCVIFPFHNLFSKNLFTNVSGLSLSYDFVLFLLYPEDFQMNLCTKGMGDFA